VSHAFGTVDGNDRVLLAREHDVGDRAIGQQLLLDRGGSRRE
jgi:hypothetical protein